MHTRMQAVEVLHLAVRILTLPPIVIGVTLLLMYALEGFLTLRELLVCELFLLLIPHCGIPAAGNPSHRKGPAERAARHGAGMQRRRIHCRLSLVTAGTLLMACPYSVSLLRYFHRGPAAAQCRAWLSCKRPRLQYNGSGTSADLEAASPLHHTVCAANRGGIPLLLEAVASYAAPAPGRLGGEPPGLWDFHPVLRNRLRPSSPLLKRCTY